MKLLKFSGKLKKLSRLLIIRRVDGASMQPAYMPGSIVVAARTAKPPKPGDVVIVRHNELEKIKRITKVQLDKIYLEGDNIYESTDSRHFGWLDMNDILGKVIWPVHPAKQKFPK